jgi:hypothetical protein
MEVLMPKLHVKQMEVWNSPARFRVVVAGRRWGKTRLGVALCADVGAKRGGHAWWVAPSYKMAEVGWRTMRNLCRQIPGVRVREGERALHFPDGGFVMVRSADDPQSLRGESLDLVVPDEAAFMKKGAWYEALRPALSDRKGKAVFISSPYGKNYFWDLYRNGLDPEQPDWESWRFPTSTNPFVDAAEIEAARRELPERVFRQEYLAEFIEDAGGVFQGVRMASVAARAKRRLVKHYYVMGVDFARYNDFTVISVIDATKRVQVALERFNDLNWMRQRERIKEAVKRWRPTVVLAEANSIGGPNIEALQMDGIRVEPFVTTASSKGPLIDGLAIAIERRAAGHGDGVALLDDPVQIGELEAYQIERLGSGGYRYSAPEGQHDDTVIATALAVEAMKRGSGLSIRWA